jgi:hypothetical protein
MSVAGSRGYAVVSCHVERPLDDEVWRRYRRLIARATRRFPIASLMRPPVESEDAVLFVSRAQEAAGFGPLGHHIHWTSPTHARPTRTDPAAEVRREGEWLRARGLEPRFFCGGGWYTDARVMVAVAELGYVDCTATATRPPRLAPGSPRASLAQPAWVRLEDGLRVLELPATHSLGAAARSVFSPLPRVVHLYFHDYELLDARRAAALSAVMTLLARRRTPVSLAEIGSDREVVWSEVCAD